MGPDTPSASVLPALDPGRVTAIATPMPTLHNADKDSTLLLPHSSMVAATMRQASTALPPTSDKATRPAAPSSHDATDYRVPSYPHPHSHQPAANPTVRHPAPEVPRIYDPRPSEYPPVNVVNANLAPYDSSSRFQPPPPSQRHRLPHSLGVSQATSSTNDADLVFTPPSSEGGRSPSKPNSHDSSQDSQLLQLSQIAAAQERIPENGIALSRKRMADGMVKPTYERPSLSPAGTASHTRNTSAVSMASTATSRLGELSAELKTRLSYAMVKVNNGWQSHSIDQVESLASRAASPTSSNSTVHMRNGSSASPQLSNLQRIGSHASTVPANSQQYPTSSQQYPPGSQQYPSGSQPHPSASQQQPQQQHSQGRPVESSYARESGHFAPRYSPTQQAEPIPSVTLAPPAPIQPTRQQFQHPRRNSVPRNTQAFLAINHQPPPQQGPNTAGQPSPYLSTHHHRTSLMEPPLYPPHQNVREQDAIESLLFMSSPGNSANLKHGFPSSSQPLSSSQPPLSSSQPLPSGHAQPQQRTALPSSQPRKSLPSARPANHPRAHQTLPQPIQKRVGFQKSPNAMDMDDGTYGVSPYSNNNNTRGTPRKRGGYNGHAAGGGELQQYAHAHAHAPMPKLKQMPVSSGLTVPSRPSRTGLKDEDIDRMLELAAARERGDSDSEGEIQIPVSRGRREGAGIVRA
ncbi:hypothetical protein NEUTE1DRAFT_78103 [Neurospora tetrasperma FGSC 2508]|uniref:Uncharacterized protein n=1 Tax=Neurospora tetrasperma (strain FGSC 2508 / ATCC MYA-4615 / P0657) TaxID=510951 RepID=F8MH02_NEUT8|nr:uncharacterized protein NEUTE1DRAFT_78103 [Neurospora tetrasperma FGSC 2508]EGO58721.1 hypothetical protein NEUTE1DRAFT_78103 [Neurospora tetrasperma FGSC 2508]EGZ72810.1 hypothetical protein NEUTE2DRAFT_85290 [Neurospora tetrasperma FGSC 2509]